MNPIGIQAMAVNCSLGSDFKTIWHNMISGDGHFLTKDKHYLFNKETYLGKAAFHKKTIKPAFDYRVNHLLLNIFSSIEDDYQKLTKSLDKTRIGIVLGTSTAGVDGFENALSGYDKSGQWPNDYRIYEQRMGSISEFLADYLQVYGPCMSISTACSSSTKALLTARRWLNEDMCDLVIAGGVDVLCHLTVNGFDALGALSYEPSLPFSINRCGINIGEGGALMLLTKDTAKLNILGGGESSDAHHISSPDPSAKGAIIAIKEALTDAELTPDKIDYINLHGTGTLQNDAMESLAINRVFGEHTACSSTKPFTGHTLGAAGAIEAVLSGIMLTDINSNGVCIPHVYDGFYDPEIATIKLVSKVSDSGYRTAVSPQKILSNSFAFGGSNASIIIGTL